MPGSCGDCANCLGIDDDVYGTGEYICNLDDTPEGCPECVGNGPCPGWKEIPHTHKIQFELRDCIAVSLLSKTAEAGKILTHLRRCKSEIFRKHT